MGAFTRLENDNVLDSRGRLVFVGPGAFETLPLEKQNCVLCCRKGVKFNQEHVIPNWLLKASSTQQKSLVFLSSQLHRLSTYRIRLCKQCNDAMADLLEAPVSAAFKGGYSQLASFSKTQPDVLYAWLNWIFFKTHFKDRFLDIHRDKRKGGAKISSLYKWSGFHDIFHLARAPLYGHEITEKALGTIRIFRVSDHDRFSAFNYADNIHGRLIYIRLHDCAVLAALGDGRTVERVLNDVLVSVGDSVTVFQLSEILTEFHFAGVRMRSEARLDHEFRPSTGKVILEMHPGGKVTFASAAKKKRDELLRYNLTPQFVYAKMSRDWVRDVFERVERENFSFIPCLKGLERTYPEQQIAIW